jgi:glycerol uptake facilitator protein
MLSRGKDTTAYAGELIGTFILVFFGLGSVHVASLTDCGAGLLHVAAVWGMGVAVAIMVTGPMSGAHLNPAITLAFFKNGDMPARRVLPYIIAQFLGAFLAAAIIYAVFSGMISQFESVHNITRGMAGSNLSGSMYGEYFPNPGMAKAGMTVGIGQAMIAEAMGTLLLAVAIFSIVRSSKNGAINSTLVPVLIGVALTTIIFVVAPLTQAGMNPARDFAPRIFAFFAGWGKEAFSVSPLASFLVYVLAPIIGAVTGQTIFRTAVNAIEKSESLPVTETV